MKKSLLLEGCNTYEEIATRVAEILVWNDIHELGVRKQTSSKRSGDDSLEWKCYCSTISILFDDRNDRNEGEVSEFYALVDKIRTAVEVMGVDNYNWSWKK